MRHAHGVEVRGKRRQYKKKLENGERDGAGYKGMTAERVARLDELGMVWDGMLERKKGPGGSSEPP
jgi:hypothetical protein